MKRRDVLKKLQKAAKNAGLSYSTRELTRHTSVTIGATSRTLGRHAEVDETTAHSFWEQFSRELGNGWWR